MRKPVATSSENSAPIVEAVPLSVRKQRVELGLRLFENKVEIKRLKKQQVEYKKVLVKTGKEFEDALADYNFKYRPDKPSSPRK